MGTELINLQNILGGVWVKVGVGLGGVGLAWGWWHIRGIPADRWAMNTRFFVLNSGNFTFQKV